MTTFSYTEAMSKVLENKKEKETKLLNAAFELFTQKGFHNVPISEIAKKAGVAKGTFYLYFKDKHELRDVLIVRASQEILTEAVLTLRKNDIRGLEDAVIFIINQIIAQLEANPVLLNFIERDLSYGMISSSLKNVYTEDSFHLSEIFSNLVERNNYHFDDNNVILFIIIDMAGSLAYTSIIHQIPKPIDDFKTNIFDAVRAILQTGKPA